MSDKQKFPLAIAARMGDRMRIMLKPVTSRVVVVGSVRREKPLVGDVELLYVPKWERVRVEAGLNDLFATEQTVNLTDAMLEEWLARKWIAKRVNSAGAFTWGAENKYAVATATGIPVDFFSTVEKHFWNNLVCRTGSAESNIRIAAAARAKGCEWHPMGSGFTKTAGDGKTEYFHMASEPEVFAFAGLPYLEPKERS